MRKIVILLAILFMFSAATKAQYVTVPDPYLRGDFISQFPTCFNGLLMDTTCTAEQSSLFLFQGYSNYDGLQYFKNVQKITMGGGSGVINVPNFPKSVRTLSLNSMTNVTTLIAYPDSMEVLLLANDVSITTWPTAPATLRRITCDIGTNTILPILPNTLDTLECSGIGLTVLPPLPDSLKFLDCSYNSISTLPALPAALKFLKCRSNNISGALPLLPQGIQTIDAGVNHINAITNFPSSLKSIFLDGQHTTLPIPALPGQLQILDVSDNSIGSLPSLPASLARLYAKGCGLNVLPALPESLVLLECEQNNLTYLPALPGNLTSLECQHNQLTSLPRLPLHLQILKCSDNAITGLPALPQSLTVVNCIHNQIYCFPFVQNGNTGSGLQITMDDKITCLPNSPTPDYFLFVDHPDPNNPTTYAYNSYNYPVCNSTHDYLYRCQPTPRMKGSVYNDNNHNGVKDADEPYRPNVKVGWSDGYFTFTDNNGHYEIPATDTGNYTLKVYAPGLYIAVPLQYDYSFNTYDTVVTGNFALQPTAFIDSLSISLAPINASARPGFAYPYLVSYTNVGTTTLTPNIYLNYDSDRLNYDSSSNGAITNNGHTLSLAETAMVPGEQKIFTAYFTVKTTSLIGDTIRAKAGISANAITVTDSTAGRIRGSFDPNDKSATPALSPAEVADGEYIYYTVRFQNTGTDTAFNVLISDGLSDLLQPSTLQMVNTSHPCHATVIGDSVYFDYHNILLPDSNVNEIKSHGFVTFRIKPQPTVTLNTVIPNKAGIYFDYNSAVLTNTAVTNIGEPIPVVFPFELVSFAVTRTSATGANATWSTNNENNNVQSYDIEMSVDQLNFTAIASQTANGNQVNSYTKVITIPNSILYFRLKMINPDGSFNYSPVVIVQPQAQPSFALISFNATRTSATSADITWSTNNEVSNVQSYDIEMSTDQLNFATIASQNANGNQANDYTKTVVVPNSIVYLRLKINNIGGSHAYSSIRMIQPQAQPAFELVSFTVAQAIGNNAILNWSTRNEAAGQFYNIELSNDGNNFDSVAIQHANGNLQNDYVKTIAVPVKNILYFRLSIKNANGNETYSQVITLINDKAQPFVFSNNPVKDMLIISVIDDELKNSFANIYNAQGSLIKKILFKQDIEHVNVKGFAAGVYVLVTEKGSRQFIISR